jgi:adenosylcobinamide-GDP ribazoletransferase
MTELDAEPTDMHDDRLLAEWWRETKVAAAFLTRFPVAESLAPMALGPIPIGGAARGFPTVGAAIGAGAAIVYGVAASFDLPPAVAAILAIGAMVLATGGLHEDGLADMADGFGGGRDRDHVLAIMRDSRIGAYGVIALILIIGLRILCVAELHGTFTAALALIATAAGSRTMLPLVLHYVPAARADGLGHDAGRPDRRMLIDATALGAALVLIGLGPFGGLLAILSSGMVAWAIANHALRRIGGQTGDVLGAIQQAVEATILVVAVATQP